MINNFFLFLVAFLNLFATLSSEAISLFPVHYKRGAHFSIGNYDIYGGGNDPAFPVIQHKFYDVVELETQNLPAGRFRKIVQLIDPETGLDKIFSTRVIDPIGTSRVIEVSKTIDVKYRGHPRFQQTWEKYEVVLEDGEILELSFQVHSEPNSDLVLPEDTILFLDEKPYDGFDRVSFKICILREDKEIGIFGGREDYPLVVGPSRKEDTKSVESTILTLKGYRTVGGSEKFFLWNFDSFEGEWLLNERTRPAKTGLSLGSQFEPILQQDDNQLHLKLAGTDDIFQFRRIHRGQDLNSSMKWW